MTSESKSEAKVEAKEVKAPKNAYITLVMCGDAYVPGAIALAQSLRCVKTSADIVCMVTPDVKQITELKSIFDHVIEVPYIEFKSNPLPSQLQNDKYTPWISKSYTKWNLLSFVQYNKVIFVDADMVFWSNVDALFDMHAPAATFSTPWATQFIPKHTEQKKKRAGRLDETFTFNYPTKHGAKVTPTMIMNGLRGNSVVFIASLVLLVPGASILDEFKALIGAKPSFGFKGCFAGHDEQSLAYFYAQRGTSFQHIDQKYNFISHKINWLWRTEDGRRKRDNPLVIHHHYSKPWTCNGHWNKYPWNVDRVWWYIMSKWVTGAGRDLYKTMFPSLDAEAIKDLTSTEPDPFQVKFTWIDRKIYPWIQRTLECTMPELLPVSISK